MVPVEENTQGTLKTFYTMTDILYETIDQADNQLWDTLNCPLLFSF